MKAILSKVYVDKILLVMRAFTIFIWIVAMWLSLEIRLEVQVAFVVIIFFSDALDGIFSRRFTLPKQQYWFRILDSTVDKFGILFFLSTLYFFRRINITSYFIILGYNALLVVFPLICILGKSMRKIDWIQATMWSRFYAMSVGIFCFVGSISYIALQYNFLWDLYFNVLGIVSFVSHINKVKRIKGEV